MITTFFDLATKLVHNYIGARHDQTLKETFVPAANLNQYFLYQDAQKTTVLLIVSVSKVSETQQVINLIYNESKIDTIFIDWDTFTDVKFPLDEVNLSAELIAKFNAKIDTACRESDLTQLFKKQVKPPHSPPKASTGPQSLIDTAASNYSKRYPDKPDFDDEYEMQAHPRPAQSVQFPPIGDRDLDPVPNPGLGSFLDPLQPGGRDGGMYPSMQHPLFDRTRGGRQGVPPGARYDDPLSEGNLGSIGDGLPGFRRPSGGPGSGPGGFGGF